MAVELERNLAACIAEKAAKTAAVRAKHPHWTWWLLLSDQITYGIPPDAISIPVHPFDKIILINPLDHTKAYEV